LRELFAKVMKNNNDLDDGVYDWNILNGLFVFSINLNFFFKSFTDLDYQVVVVGKSRQ